MVNAVVSVGYPVVFDIREGGSRNGEKHVWVDGKNGEGLISIGDVRVVDALGKVHDHEFPDRVGNIDALGNTVVIDGGASVGDGGDGGCWRYRAEDKGRGDGGSGTRGDNGGGDVVHDVLRGVVEVEASNFEGHKMVARRLERGESSMMLYLYRVGDD